MPINSQTGEPQDASGWSQDDPANATPGVTPSAPGASALAPPAYLSKYAGQIEGLGQKEQSDFEDYEQKSAPAYARLERTLESGQPKPPNETPIKPPPKPEDFQKDALGFASAMAVLGAVAGKFTRNPGNAALNAFAGAIKGWQQGNLQAYQQKTEEWKEAADQTVKNNEMLLDKYKMVLEDRKMNIDEQMASIQLIASQYHDKMTFDAAAAQNYTLVASIYDKNQQYTDKVKAATDKLYQKHLDQDEKNHTNAKWLASPEGQAWISTLPTGEQAKYNGFVQQYGQGVDPSSVHEVAALIGTGKMAPLSGFALRSPWGQAVMADVGQRFPGYQGTEFVGHSSLARAVGQRGGQITTSAVEADKTFNLARQASADFPRGQFVPLNRLRQLGAQATSNPQYRKFMDANESAITAYAATMSRSGVNTVAAQSRAHAMLDTADSQEAYNAGLDQLQAEVDAVRTAPGEAMKEGQESLSGDNADVPKTGGGNDGWGDVTVH